MLPAKVTALLNEQIQKELYSAYIYLEMANYYADAGLDGFAHWFMQQAREEEEHAMKIRAYLLDNDVKLKLLTIDAPGETYADYGAPLHKALEHERFVTALIHNIYAAAADEKDYRTMKFLSWFIDEQNEEEANASTLVTKYELYGGDPAGLYALDRELGKRDDD